LRAAQSPDLTSADLRSSVLRLAVPAVGRTLLQTVVAMVSLMIVGRLGPAGLAAVGLANRLIFVGIAALTGVSVGATALVARYVGARDSTNAREVVKQSLILGLGLGVAIAVVGYFLADEALRGMMVFEADPDPTVIRLGASYLRCICLSMALGCWLFMGNAVLQGAGDMKTPLYVMAVVNAVNLALAYPLVFGVGPVPALGVTGAGIAAGVARALGGLIALAVLTRRGGPVRIALDREIRLRRDVALDILRVGVPAAVESFVRQGSQILYSMFIAGLGTLPIAANSVAMSVQSLSFMPGFGFSLAATALVGQNLGAGKERRAEQAGFEALRWSIIFATAMGLLFFFAPGAVVRLYTTDPQVISSASACLRIIALSQPALAAVMVLSGGLRGAGDTRWVMYVTAAGNWGIRLTGAYLLGLVYGYGLVGVWVAMALDQFVRALVVAWRFKSGVWKRIRVGRYAQAPCAVATDGADSCR